MGKLRVWIFGGTQCLLVMGCCTTDGALSFLWSTIESLSVFELSVNCINLSGAAYLSIRI